MKIAILAAGKSSRIFKKIKKNKCLLNIGKETLINKSIKEILKVKNIKENDIYIVTGFKPNLIKKHVSKKYKNIQYIHNKHYNRREMLYSMLLAMRKIDSDFICVYSDILFSHKVLNKLISFKKNLNIKIPVLKNWEKIWKIKDKPIYEDAEDLKLSNDDNRIKSIGQKIKKLKPDYQYMGIAYFPKIEFKKISKIYLNLKNVSKMHLTSFLDKLIKKRIKVYAVPILSFWYEFDDLTDYKNFLNLIKTKNIKI